MSDLIAKEQNLTKKEALGNYVHDMVDMEVRAFSLKKNMEECREKARIEESDANYRLESARKEKESAEQTAKGKAKAANSLLVYIGGFTLLIWFLSWLFEHLLIWIFKRGFPVPIAILVLFGGAILGIILGIGSHISDKKDVQKKNDKAWKQAIQAYIETEKKTAEAMIYVQRLRFHANDLERDLAELHENMQKNYALNIVPPDYRRLECLVWIDYAFRNDQVDTMREATFECDKHVMHGETMQALQELAVSIRSVATLLENMNNRISAMNENLFQIAQTQDSLLSETESARYAMESVRTSNEKLAYYEDLKRQGAFYL